MMYKDRQKLSGIWYNGSLDEKIDDKKILLLLDKKYPEFEALDTTE